MATQKTQMSTGAIVAIVLVVAVLAVMGWSYATDGNLNPFTDTVASAQIGDSQISITEDRLTDDINIETD